MKRVAVALLLFFLAASVHADTCVSTSDPWRALSKSGEWRLEAKPTRKQDRWTGTLLHKTTRGAWRRQARWTFVNAWGPGGAAVANDGTVITFNNICSAGVGPNIVVIYRPDGTLVRTFALSDLLIEDDIKFLPRTVSSIRWLQEQRIDEEAHRLVLDLAEPSPQKNVELPISLETGELLTPKRRRFVGFPTLDPVVTFRADEELLARAIAPTAATYPPVAMKARISGEVIAEVVVRETGDVESVAIVKPLPFGLDQSTVEALRKWRFQPGPRITGRVTMSFGIVTQPPASVD